MEPVVDPLKDLEATAKLYYEKDGPNQWPHIQRVKQQAEKLAKFRGKPLDLADLAAVYFHDIGKREAGLQDHGEYAAQIAGPLLKPKLTKEQWKVAIEAIRTHNTDAPSVNPTAELLRSADANVPDIAWFLRKSYNKMKAQGMSNKDALSNALRIAKKHIGTASQLKHRPKLYEKAFAAEIKQSDAMADRLTLNLANKLIQKYNQEHPEESAYV